MPTEPTTITIHEAIPYIRVRGGAQAIEYYKRAFDATEVFRLTEPSPAGRLGHAEIRIGGVMLMLSDEYPECGIYGPATIGGTSFAMHLHVSDVDALMQRAVEAGGTVIRPIENHSHGERGGTLRDPFGHEWMLGQEIEKVTPEEMQRRFDEWTEAQQSK
jgi:PhnB protein